MIFSIREGLRETLIDRGYPVEVDCGDPRPMLRGSPRQRHRVVLLRDRESPDTILAHPGKTPDAIYVRMVAYVVMVYAFAPSPGALAWEHDAETDQLVDAVLVALYDWVAAQRAWRFEFVSGRMLRVEELQGTPAEALPLAGYQMRFRVARSVNRQTYSGALTYDTHTLTDVEMTTEVSLDGETYEEIA